MQAITRALSLPLYGNAATRRFEQAATAALPAHTLMQRAGLAAARLSLALAPHAQHIWVACGPGNNGGDGLEAAMHLHRWGKKVTVTWLGASGESQAPAEALTSLASAQATGVPFAKAPPADFDFALDALLGIGAAPRAPDASAGIDPLAQWLALLRGSPQPVLALDIPSLLGAETGTDFATELIATHAHEMRAAALNDAEKEPGTESQQAFDQIIYIQVSRGVAMRDHIMPPGLEPTVFVMINPMKLPSPQVRMQGVACVTSDDFRWEKAHIKATSLLGAVFSRQISADVGALETIMFRGDHLSEAAASNVWVVKNGKVLGVVKDNLVLEGIRFGLFEELCRANNIGFELRQITKAEVLDADELLLSSATKEVLPVTLLDGVKVGTGLPGPVYAKLYAAYQQAKEQAV